LRAPGTHEMPCLVGQWLRKSWYPRASGTAPALFTLRCVVCGGAVCGAWCVARGVWCVVHGAWCVVRGAWCVVRGAGSWCVVRGVWCVVRGVRRAVCGVWCMVYGSSSVCSPSPGATWLLPSPGLHVAHNAQTDPRDRIPRPVPRFPATKSSPPSNICAHAPAHLPHKNGEQMVWLMSHAWLCARGG
jgi:hypothetical protein